MLECFCTIHRPTEVIDKQFNTECCMMYVYCTCPVCLFRTSSCYLCACSCFSLIMLYGPRWLSEIKIELRYYVTSNVTTITEVRSARAHLFAGMRHPLMSVIAKLYYVAKKFLSSRVVSRAFLFTNDKGRLAPLICHTVHQTLKSFSTSINTKARKYDIK